MKESGQITESTKKPNLWVCRRVADFPDGAIAKFVGVGFSNCPGCGAPIVFNTARKVDAGKVCMQCAGIEPLPYPAS